MNKCQSEGAELKPNQLEEAFLFTLTMKVHVLSWGSYWDYVYTEPSRGISVCNSYTLCSALSVHLSLVQPRKLNAILGLIRKPHTNKRGSHSLVDTSKRGVLVH